MARILTGSAAIGARMKPVSDVRYERFLELLAEAGSVTALALRTGKSISQISQLKSRSKHSITGTPRAIGDELARQFESAFDKPVGWMDTQPVVEPTNISGPITQRKVPMLSLMQAGLLTEESLVQSQEFVTAWHSEPGPHSFGLRVEGDSMVSASGLSFPPGTTIIVDPDRKPVIGDYVIARDMQDRPTFRQLMGDGITWYLRPLSTAYPTIEIDGPARVIAVVIEYAVGGRL